MCSQSRYTLGTTSGMPPTTFCEKTVENGPIFSTTSTRGPLIVFGHECKLANTLYMSSSNYVSATILRTQIQRPPYHWHSAHTPKISAYRPKRRLPLTDTFVVPAVLQQFLFTKGIPNWKKSISSRNWCSFDFQYPWSAVSTRRPVVKSILQTPSIKTILHKTGPREAHLQRNHTVK